MTLAELLAEFRAISKDTENPPHWDNAQVTGWINEAEREACIRARLLFDKTTAAYCEIAVTAGNTTYNLDAHVAEIVAASLVDSGGASHPVRILTRQWLDHQAPGWRMGDARRPEALTHYDKHIELNAAPDAAYTLKLEIYRFPVADMVAASDTPEIAEDHHRHLVKWALYRAYGVQDADAYDKDAEARYLGEFTALFGQHPGANLRKQQNAESPRAMPAWC